MFLAVTLCRCVRMGYSLVITGDMLKKKGKKKKIKILFIEGCTFGSFREIVLLV